MNNLKFNCKVFTFFLFSFTFYGQTLDLGKVTIQELEEKEHPLERDAEAAVIFNNGKSYIIYSESIGFELVTEVETKIKIYKKEGYDFANVEVPFYVGGSEKETVNFSKAYTYNLVDGKIEKSKLKSDGEFREETNKFWNKRKISLPNVKEGSIVEYKYVIRSPYLTNFPEWYFQKSIPVNYSKFVTSIPEYYVFNSRVKGYVSPKKVVTTKNTNYNYVEKGKSLATNYSIGSASRTAKTISFIEEVTTFTAENLSSMKDEDFVSNIKNYTSCVSYELAYIKFPNSPIKTLSVTWEDVTKSIYESEDFGLEVKKTGYFENEIDQLLVGKNSKEEKIIAIYNFVKSNIKWNEFNGIYCDQGVKNAYKNKTGNVAEINLMLTAMLRYAGLEANPVLISTRSNGVPLFPTRTAFNYIISAVEIQNGLLLLDATDENAIPNILPTRTLNWEGRLIRKDGTSANINLNPTILSKEITIGMIDIDSKGEVLGKIRTQHFDYNAYRFRNNYLNLTKESYIESIEKKYSNAEINEYETINERDLSKPVTEQFSFKHSNILEIIGDKMYFSPMLFYAISENPFKMEKREYPVDFVYPQQDKFTFIIKIPEGYQVESIPKATVLSLSDNLIVYKFSIENLDDKIQISSILDINQSIISPLNYEDLKMFFKNVVEKQTEKIVLKKT